MPHFALPPACIQPLSAPSEYLGTLLNGINASHSRITLSSLYLGTGELEQALASSLRERLITTPNLHASLAFDLNRAIRGVKPSMLTPSVTHSTSAGLSGTTPYRSSAEMLLELFRGGSTSGSLPCPDLEQRLKVSLVLLPQLRGLLGRVVPARYVEAGGVWHAKAYIFDRHTVVLTGANLSTDYFTTRQDRYVVVSCAGGVGGEECVKEVGRFADYLHDTIAAITSLPGSYTLDGSGRVRANEVEKGASEKGKKPLIVSNGLPAVNFTPLPLNSPLNAAFSKGLKALLVESSSPPTSAGKEASERGEPLVHLYPRWQLGALGVNCDEAFLLHLLATLGPSPTHTLHLATGYFNMPRTLQGALIRGVNTCVHMLTASPTANGFWGAKGVAGAIPLAYCQLEKAFYKAVESAGRLMQDPEGSPSASGIAIHEYSRPGWTFHAKGLWLHRYAAAQPIAGEGKKIEDDEAQWGDPVGVTTIVGSSNYGQRGLHRDLELQVEMSTRDKGLMGRLALERDGLFNHHPVRKSTTPLLPNKGGEAAWVRAIGSHLTKSGLARYGRERDVWCPRATPHRALHWKASWSTGVWIKVGKRVLAGFF